MRKLLSIVILLLLCFSYQGSAQKLIVSNFVELPTDISAREFEVLDVNDDPCAIVKIYTGLKSIKVDGNQGVERVEEKNGAFWVWVPQGTRQLKISKDGFALLPYYFEKELEKSSVYSFELATDELFSIIISTGNEIADVSINHKKYSSNSTISGLPAGEYPVVISKIGFKPVIDTITVSKGKLFFAYNLTRATQHILKIESNPTNAMLTINGQPIGRTAFTGFYYPGEYRIQLAMIDYMPIDTILLFDPEKSAEFKMEMVKNVGWINLTVTPANTLLTIDGVKVMPGIHKLNAGMAHQITGTAQFYKPYIEAISIEKNSTLQKSILMQPQEGELSFIIEPTNIPIQVSNNRGQSANWVGNKVQKLPIGNYLLNLNQKGYFKIDTSFIIQDEQRTNLNLKLTERKFNRIAAGTFSTLFPGGGQFYTQRNKVGLAYMFSTLALAGTATYFYQKTDQLANEYEAAKTMYDNETSIDNIPTVRAQMVDAYTEYEDAAKTRNIFTVATAGVYLLNIVDAVVFAKYYSPSNPKSKLNVGFFSNSKSNGVNLAYTF